MSKIISIKSSKDFSKVYRKGTSKADSILVLYVLRNGRGYNRIGISVSRKVGKSVVRNRVKRRIREAYSRHRESIKAGYDLVFISRVRAAQADFATIEASILNLLNKHNLFIEKDSHESNRDIYN